MTNNKTIERYINSRMVEMDNILLYAQDQMNECDDPSKGKEYWRTWALDYVRSEYEKAFGTLVYVNVYEQSIDNEQYDVLVGKLFQQWTKSEEDIWRSIC